MALLNITMSGITKIFETNFLKVETLKREV